MTTQLFKTVQNTISTIKAADGTPLIKHFDLWNENLQYIEEEQPHYTPATYIEIHPIQWQTLPRNHREANITFTLHTLVHITAPIPTQPHNKQGTTVGTTPLEALAISDAIYLALQKHHHHTPTHTIDTITITTTQIEHQYDQLLLISDTYQCHATHTPKQKTITKTPTPKINMN